MLCKKTWPNWKGRPKDGIREILKVSAIRSKTKSLLKLSCMGVYLTWVLVFNLYSYIQACGKVKTDFTCGRSKIFIRNPITVFDLEGRRKERLNDLAILLQKTYRGWHHRNRVSLKLTKPSVATCPCQALLHTWRSGKSLGIGIP